MGQGWPRRRAKSKYQDSRSIAMYLFPRIEERSCQGPVSLNALSAMLKQSL